MVNVTGECIIGHLFIYNKLFLEQGLSMEEAEQRGVPVRKILSTAWHSVLLFKHKPSFGSLIIWDPVRRTHKYPFLYSKGQGLFYLS